MDWGVFVDVSGIGVVFLLNVVGALALVLPGRLDPDHARRIGLGRHVEALLILSFASTVYLSGIGNVPVYIDRNGVVAFSLVGAVLPALLSLRFLWRAGWLRGSLAVVGVAAVSWVSYVVSQPVPDMGIVARYPFFLLPSLAAAAVATVLAPRSIAAIPIAYACGSLGALVGGDLVRFNWVVTTQKAVAGSFGGAEFFDLVFLAGLWGAAFAAIPLVGYWSRLSRRLPEWEAVALTAREGRLQAALRDAVGIVEMRVQAWAQARGLEGRPARDLQQLSFAAPVLEQTSAALRLGPALPVDHARALLERLSALDRRLRRPASPRPAPPRLRALAGLVDLVPVFILAALAYTLAPNPEAQSGVPPALQGAARIFFAVSTGVSAHILLPLVSEWAFQGASLGKALTGLRVRRLEGGPPTGWDAVVRNLGRLLDLPLFYLIAFASPEYQGRQRLGDYFAGTVVIAMPTSTPVTPSPKPIARPAIQPIPAKRRAPRKPGRARSKAAKRPRK